MEKQWKIMLKCINNAGKEGVMTGSLSKKTGKSYTLVHALCRQLLSMSLITKEKLFLDDKKNPGLKRIIVIWRINENNRDLVNKYLNEMQDV